MLLKWNVSHSTAVTESNSPLATFDARIQFVNVRVGNDCSTTTNMVKKHHITSNSSNFGCPPNTLKRSTTVQRGFRRGVLYGTRNIMKIKIHSSCEIEYFVETHLCKLCDTPIARITSCVSSLRI